MDKKEMNGMDKKTVAGMDGLEKDAEFKDSLRTILTSMAKAGKVLSDKGITMENAGSHTAGEKDMMREIIKQIMTGKHKPIDGKPVEPIKPIPMNEAEVAKYVEMNSLEKEIKDFEIMVDKQIDKHKVLVDKMTTLKTKFWADFLLEHKLPEEEYHINVNGLRVESGDIDERSKCDGCEDRAECKAIDKED